VKKIAWRRRNQKVAWHGVKTRMTARQQRRKHSSNMTAWRKGGRVALAASGVIVA